MDVDRLLNFEKRTGIKDSDIDEFTEKANAVQEAIKGMMNGTIKPEDVKVEGIDSLEEIEKKEFEKQQSLLKRRKNEEEMRVKRKVEEKQKWWDGAELFRTHGGDRLETLNEEEQEKVQTKLNRYTMDYSVWDKWVDETPATVEEQKVRDLEIEKKRNEEFENSNKEFCSNFVKDIADRTKNREKKESNANIFRLKGNNYYKKGEYDQALNSYQEALKVLPYDCKTLLNMAQVYIKQKLYPDALEFISRTLYLNPNQAKALSRQGFVYDELMDMDNSLISCKKAFALEPGNTDIQFQLEAIQRKVDDKAKETMLQSYVTNDKEKPIFESIDACCSELILLLSPSAPTGGSTAEERYQTLIAIVNGIIASLNNKQLSMTLLAQVKLYVRVKQFSVASGADPESLSCMQLLSQFLNIFLPLIRAPSAAVGNDPSRTQMLQLISVVLELLTSLCMEENANLIILHDSKCLSGIFDCGIFGMTLSTDTESGNNDRKQWNSSVKCSLMLLHQALVHAPKTHTWLMSKLALLFQAMKFELYRCGQSIQQLTLQPPSSSPALKTAQESSSVNYLTVIEAMLMLVKAILFSPVGKKTITDQLASPVESKAGVIGLNQQHTILYYISYVLNILIISKKKLTLPSDKFSSICDLGVDISVGYSQFTVNSSSTPNERINSVKSMFVQEYNELALRTILSGDKFTLAAPGDAVGTSMVDVKYSVIGTILRLYQLDPSNESNILAALMNITIENTMLSNSIHTAANTDGKSASDVSIRDVLCDESLPHAKIVIQLATSCVLNDANAAIDQATLLRKLGLLSRLVTNINVQKLLMQPKSFNQLCTFARSSIIKHFTIENPAKSAVNIAARVPLTTPLSKASGDEINHVIRILATISPVAVSSVECRNTLIKEGVLEHIIQNIFPTPKTELGEYTSNSVVQMPKILVDIANTPVTDTKYVNNATYTLIIGNAARILLSLAEHDDINAIIFHTSYHSIERYICSMATCTDIRIRKNIAILLAKGCKYKDSVRELVSKLRGIQMMIELQNKF